ncbi:sulfatase modifying factor 1 [Lutibacter agarilyticus]|uniref:Sulfatase modifying factor 1 n=1 Tax=Lutibacter agarilyticus TaxID=1109740 RepID=A0A238VJ99_9FLAO|nr:formylglycine-generating enzyme family protein [Lutibacter agarilyticus]SNR34470.1 sulfatase modifying factor 1 [Lutibacter agarilyticus]
MKLYPIFIVFTLLVVSCKETPKKVVEETKAAKIVKKLPVEVDTSTMVYFEGGNIEIGSVTGLPNEQPVFNKQINSFYLDKNLVTVAEFRKFIESTSYTTEADKFGDSGVFLFETNNWTLLKGANWEFPLGPDQEKAKDNHPVTQVSFNDAKAYAKWVGKRLPTEFEWEFAAKNGVNSTNAYAWGNNLIVNGKYMANVWQGATIDDNTVLDGYLLTSPVGTFGETKMGLNDMAGNVWQWCDSYYKPYPENMNAAPVNSSVRTTRGGSFMYDQALEKGYTTTFRGQNSIDTSLFNMGFRCAK